MPERAASTTVLAQVGLTEVANKRPGGFSLGMAQRLGLAAALLGDPKVLILDEPANGLDPQGINWLRNLLKHLAGAGPHRSWSPPTCSRRWRSPPTTCWSSGAAA